MALAKFFIFIYLSYLRLWAKLALKINKPLIIGLTGSAGKSSLRNALFSAISPEMPTKMIEKGNSETGVPLGILGLEAKNYSLTEWLILALKAPFGLNHLKNIKCLIVEMGVDEPYPPKNMDYLLTIVRPKIGILLNVFPVHTMQFKKILLAREQRFPEQKKQKVLLKAIAQQKSRLLTSLAEDGTAIFPQDFFYLPSIKSLIKAGQLTFGKNKADCQIIDYQVSVQKGSVIKFGYQRSCQEKDYTLNFRQYLLPEFYCQTMAAAFLAGIALGLKPKQITNNLITYFSLPPGRTSLIPGIKQTTIIDSSYNSSLQPLLGMLDLLATLSTPGKSPESADDTPDEVRSLHTLRESAFAHSPESVPLSVGQPAKGGSVAGGKIAVLGDMRELGEQAKIEHEKAAEKAVEAADEIVLVGPLMKQYFLPRALKLNFPKEKIFHYANAFQAADFLKNHIRGKEIILVKGSQNTIFLEIVVKKLMKEPQKAKQLLCRQTAFWEKQRRKILHPENPDLPAGRQGCQGISTPGVEKKVEKKSFLSFEKW